VKISDDGLALVMAFEGCLKPVAGRAGFFRPYLCPAGVLTIGWGHTNHHPPAFGAAEVWSQERCDQVLRGDLAGFERRVEALARIPLAQHEFDALVSWAYNTGGPASAGVWRAVGAGRRKDVPAELAKWNKGGGKVLAGLVRRRKAEGFLFAGKVDEALQVAGAKKPTPRPAATVVPAAPVPPDLEPVAPPAPAAPAARRGWLSSLIAAFRKA
jgi:lysozyme